MVQRQGPSEGLCFDKLSKGGVWTVRNPANPTKSVHPELVEGSSFLFAGGMSFWAYMLHCRGGAFYVGQTDDLPRRIAQHQSGALPGFTYALLPLELVWSQEFQTREEARAAEHKLKGWSRAKKLALIRGDWDRISALARSASRLKDRPS